MAYKDVFFAQGEDAIDWLTILETEGVGYLVRELDAAGVDFAAEHAESQPYQPWGNGDQVECYTFQGRDYVVSYNHRLGYLGVSLVII